MICQDGGAIAGRSHVTGRQAALLLVEISSSEGGKRPRLNLLGSLERLRCVSGVRRQSSWGHDRLHLGSLLWGLKQFGSLRLHLGAILAFSNLRRSQSWRWRRSRFVEQPSHEAPVRLSEEACQYKGMQFGIGGCAPPQLIFKPAFAT
jgi:hypothetical protein